MTERDLFVGSDDYAECFAFWRERNPFGSHAEYQASGEFQFMLDNHFDAEYEGV